MNKKHLRLLMAIILGLFVLIPATHSHAVQIEVVPASVVAGVGSSIDVELVISGLGLGAAPSIGIFDLNVVFDPSLLGFNDATYGDPILGDQLDLFGFGSETFTTPGGGFVNLFELSYDSAGDLNSLQADSFTLATLSFDLLGIGTSAIDIDSTSYLGDAAGAPIEADFLGGSVAAVPEPATLLLTAAGLAGLGAYIRKKKRRG